MDILVVENDDRALKQTIEYLTENFSQTPVDFEFTITSKADVDSAKTYIADETKHIDIAVFDMDMSGGGHGKEGLELLKLLNRYHTRALAILYTGWGTSSYLECMLNGVFAYVEKGNTEAMSSLGLVGALIRKAYAVKEGEQYDPGKTGHYTYMKGLGIRKNENCLSLITDVPMPRCKQDMVVARTRMLGICGTDIHNYLSRVAEPKEYNLIEFHEALGEIVFVGESASKLFSVGDWVVPVVRRCHKWERVKKKEWDFNTVKCDHWNGCENYLRADTCLQRPGYLSRGTGKYHGFGSEYFSDSTEYLVKVTKHQKEHLSYLCVLAEPMSIGWKVVRLINNKTRIKPSDTILVIGIGPIGMACVAVLEKMYPGVYINVADLVDNNHAKVEVIKRHFKSIDYTQFAKGTHGKETFKENSFNVIIDASGDAESVLPNILRLIKPEGVVGLLSISGNKAVNESDIKMRYIDKIITSEISIIGSVCASKQDMQETLRFMETQCTKEFLQDLIRPVNPVPMAELPEKLPELIATGDYIKILVDPWA